MLLDVKNLAVSYGKNPKPTIAGVSFDLNDLSPIAAEFVKIVKDVIFDVA